MPRTSPIVRALRAAHLHDASRAELLQLACDRLRGLGAPYTSVYAYMLRDGELVLEAFAGRETEHNHIPLLRLLVAGEVAPGRRHIRHVLIYARRTTTRSRKSPTRS